MAVCCLSWTLFGELAYGGMLPVMAVCCLSWILLGELSYGGMLPVMDATR